MSKAGKRLIEGAKEAVAIAKGEQPAARIWVNGRAYVPESTLLAERMAERGRCAKIADRIEGEFGSVGVAAAIRNQDKP